MKGTIVVPLVKALRVRKAQVVEMLPPELRHYLEDRILVTSWYPEKEHLVLIRCLGQSLGISDYQMMGTVLAQFELNGVYRAMLHQDDPMRTIRSFAKTWPLNHDTGKIDIVEHSPTRATITLSGFALPAKEICDTIQGYALEAIRMSGRKSQVPHVHCRTSGAPDCVWEVDLL